MIKKNLVRVLALGPALFVIVALIIALASITNTVHADEGSNWTGQYWNNPTLSGNPTLTRTDPSVHFNWATGSPDPSIPADFFSARWTNNIVFGTGTYRFRAGAEDGIVVYIDGNKIVNQFAQSNTFNTYTADVNLGAGSHSIQVDFWTSTGNAGVLFDWTQLSGTPAATATPGGAVISTTGSTIQIKAVVISTIANVRSAPTTTSNPIAQVVKNQVFNVLAQNGANTWFLIQLPDGRQGWVFRRTIYLYNGDPTKLPVSTVTVNPPPATANVQAVTKTIVLVRDAPSKRNSHKIGVIGQGEFITILQLSRTRSWVYVDFNGLKGWVFIINITVVSGDMGLLPVSDLP